MTMLAQAGIYLFLDVNSPLPHHHLNRYEPWNTYNLYYFENIFKVIEQFSHYNNTLGFIAGNEIVNDPISASVAAPYVKAVVRDIKTYIEYNSPRSIPVGYSAADDLNYRMSLAQYLECSDDNPKESVDFMVLILINGVVIKLFIVAVTIYWLMIIKDFQNQYFFRIWM